MSNVEKTRISLSLPLDVIAEFSKIAVEKRMRKNHLAELIFVYINKHPELLSEILKEQGKS